MRVFPVSRGAKMLARMALEERSELPSGKRFGLDKRQARREGVFSGVERAKQLIRSDSISLGDARRVCAFYQRFKGKTGFRAEKSLQLWGGRRFGKVACSFVRKFA